MLTSTKHSPRELSSRLENAVRIDDHEDPAAAGEHGSLLVENFRNASEAPSALADLARFYSQRPVQRHGFKILDSHAGGCGDEVAKLVQLAHSVVKNGGDDSAVAVAGRSGVAVAEAKMRDEMIALPVQNEFQMHPMRIIFAAGEAQVLLYWMPLTSMSGR
jgi:hypothetical protein